MKKKRLSILLLTAVLLCVMLAGCKGSSKSGGSLKVWMPPFGTEESFDKKFWEDELQIFAKDKGITVSVEITPWGNYEEKYLTGIASGNGPDVGYMYLEMISDYIDMNVLVPLEDYITAADRDNYLFLANGVVQGKQYMFPIVMGNPRIFVVNVDILNQAGLSGTPKTWDELVSYGLTIKEKVPGVAPFAQGWAQPSVGALNVLFHPYFWQAGGEYLNSNNEWQLNSEAGLRAAKFVHSLMHDSKIMPEAATSYDDSDIMNQFIEGKIAMTVLGASANKQLDDAKMNWDFTTSLVDRRGSTFVAADALVMLNTAKDKDLAFECMRYMTSAPVMGKFHKELAPFPPITKDGEYLDSPRFERMYTEDAAYFHTLPAIKGSSKVFDALYKNLQLVMLNQMDPQAALDDAVSYAEIIR